MNTSFSENFKELRKNRGLSQEQLATAFSISVQAVSKWECSLSYPDIELLPVIADYLDVSIDFLLRGKPVSSNTVATLDLPNDNVLRVVQCVGSTILRQDKYDPNIKIPLLTEKAIPDNTPNLSVEIWGSADIEGDINGCVTAGDGVNCAYVNGCVSAGDGVNCSDVNGSVTAGDGINCSNVNGCVNAGDGLNCGNIQGSVTAGDGVNCGNVSGGVNAGDGINCGNIDGNVTSGGDITCNDIYQNVLSCSGDIHCHDIQGDASCGGDIIYDN